MVLIVLTLSGVSSASALSAGDDSAPDASEKSSGSKGLRGVVKDGLRKGEADGALPEQKDDSGCDGGGRLGFSGDAKPPVTCELMGGCGTSRLQLLTALTLLLAELIEGRGDVGRTLGLPLKVHGTFVCASVHG